MVVVPLASTAAITMLAVPVTEASSNSIYAPVKFVASTLKNSFLLSYTNFAPSFSKPIKCVSNLLRPILSPPGLGMAAFPKRPKSGPTIIIDPLKPPPLALNISD
ncbi:hypothetical protein D3C86_1320290 [compost metagenome]